MELDEVVHLTAAVGEVCVTFHVFEDSLVEENETIELSVQSEDPAVLLLVPVTTTVIIINTDG